MCVIAWNWQPTEPTRLLLLSNRDEFYARPALAAHWWPGNQILAGRDLQAGGTWLGVSRTGRMAALTNYRLAQVDASVRPSRGALVANFLQSDVDANTYLQTVAKHAQTFQPFNLLVFDGQQLLGLESRHPRIFSVAPGIGAVSNADFDTPWPKLLRLKSGLAQALEHPSGAAYPWLTLLQDAQTAPEDALPDTGVDKDWERALSAIFIAQPDYGTRASSVVQVGQQSISLMEQTYPLQGTGSSIHFSFDLYNING